MLRLTSGNLSERQGDLGQELKISKTRYWVSTFLAQSSLIEPVDFAAELSHKCVFILWDEYESGCPASARPVVSGDGEIMLGVYQGPRDDYTNNSLDTRSKSGTPTFSCLC
jgi:hypothetical protein